MRYLAAHRRRLGALAVCALLMLPSAHADEAKPLVLLVQPILSAEQTIKAFMPLCRYLGAVAARSCRVQVMPNFLSYWDLVRRNDGVDIVIDAAHFTDYRAQKFAFDVLAKIPDTVSYSLVVAEDKLIFDPTELTGKRIATLGPPSIGAARLAGMFPNPVRQPIIIEVDSAEEGMRRLLSGKVEAAILPTPIVSRQMAQGGGVAVVMTTEPIPHIALSVSPKIEPRLRKQFRDALLTADDTEAGRAMLKDIGFPRFDPANPALYAGQANILREYWGY